jgi:acyl-CoA reductase-like NAD-dependent aldehyde dehydrogenase
MPATRAAVLKTYKLLIGGQFVRSESGRSIEVRTPSGEFIANVCRASRKDFRDAVQTARKAQTGWANRTAYNRGQILYRIAEMLENRKAEYVEELVQATSRQRSDAGHEVQVSIDRWVYYAGWSDKWSALTSSLNPVALPMHNFTQPEPTGVVGIICPDEAPLASLVSLVAPVIVSGNTVVVLLSERFPTLGLAFAEVLGVSDVPGGVVNLLSGYRQELAEHFATHTDVDGLDLCGIEPEGRATCEVLAADSVKRVHHTPNFSRSEWLSESVEDLYRITPFVEMKTVWHPAKV